MCCGPKDSYSAQPKTSIERIVKGLGWKQVQQVLICSGPWDDAFPGQCEELGMTMAAGMEAGIF